MKNSFFHSKQLNNRGVSLVELIVTILIVAILAGGAALSINVVYNANINRAAKRLVVALSETREEAMAGDDDYAYYMRLYIDSGDYRADICRSIGGSVEVLATKEIGNNRVKIDVAEKNASGGAITVGTDVSEALFTFGKKRGALESVATVDDSGAVSTAHMYVDFFVKGNNENEVIIVPATGRSYIYKVD